ncbi:MAG: S8 family serine peptidase [Armatimonadetes bacterium]|nr:S8 family serine peptidase [Armatimonadota bacterium]
MRLWKLILCALVVVGITVAWQLVASQSPQFETKIVVLKAKANLSSVFGNRSAVKRLLMQTAEQSQRELIPLLESRKQQGEVRRYHRFWIVNAIAVEGTQKVFEELEKHPAVASIYPNLIVRIPRPIPSQRITIQQNFTWGLQRIRIPEAWQTFQVQGEGVVVGVIDTGIDPDHPDLRGKVRQRNGWFDAINGRPTPYDDQGHGTHVAGTIAGGNASGTHIGVAPRTTLIIAKAFDERGAATLEWIVRSMQWMLDPDDDPNTDDNPDVVNNSWGVIGGTSPVMIPVIVNILNAWIAAKIFPAFLIGNEGPSPRTTRSPGDYPMAFAVGATDPNDQVAVFSSRGPVFWQELNRDITKPDVCAPGVDILSAIPGGGYQRMDGTSMACPHVAGTVALMISLAIKNRRYGEIDVNFLKQALEETAVDLGPRGKDNEYGSGRIDAYEALRRIPLPPVVAFPDFTGSNMEVSASEVVIGDLVEFTIRVINSGSADASNVIVSVPNIPTILSPVAMFPEDGVFDGVTRQVRWNRSSIPAGQSVVFRFQAIAESEGNVNLFAQISARDIATIVTNTVSLSVFPPQDPYEPNNIRENSRRIVTADFLSERAYLASGDEDWFVVNLPEGRAFWFEVRAWQRGSPLDAKLQITNVNGQPLPSSQVLFSASNYIGRDPVAIVKGNGNDVYLQVVADDNAAMSRSRGSYSLRIREITTDASFRDFGATALTGENALRAGEIGIVFGTLENEGSLRQQILPFRFATGLRLVQPSQARMFLPLTPSPANQGIEPGLADWLLFISDINENTLSEVPSLPSIPINIGRIWVQDKQGILFFRLEFVGRALTRLANIEMNLEIDIDLDGSADALVKLSANEQALYVGSVRRPLTYLNFSERSAEFGVNWSDLNEPTSLQVRVQLRDFVTGNVDNAPDFDWALLTKDDPTTEQDNGFRFGISPAAGTVVSNGQINVSIIADARTALVGEYDAMAQILAASSTLTSNEVYQLPVSVVSGPPARLTLTLIPTEVSSTLEPPQVTAIASLFDAAGNSIRNHIIRFSALPSDIGTIENAERPTDENGRATATINITGKVGVLTVRAEAVGTSLVASQTLTVRVGEPTLLEVTTTPAMDEQGNVRIPINSTLVLQATLKDAKGNPIAISDPPIQFQISLIPIEGEPRVLMVIDGNLSSSQNQLADEDGSVNGSIRITQPVGTRAGQISFTVSSLNAPSLPPRVVNVIVQSGVPARLVFTDSQQERELQNSITNPLIRLVGDDLAIHVRLLDAHNNPVSGQKVKLIFRRGFSTEVKDFTTNFNGEAEVRHRFDNSDVGVWPFYLIGNGIRLPDDWQKSYRILVLPDVGQISSERVRGLGLPFLPPTVSEGQRPPSLSEILGVDPQVLQGRIARYDPILRQFVLVDPNAPWTEPGVGLFIKPRQTITIRPRIAGLSTTETLELNLQPGWNLISFPIVSPVTWYLPNFKVKSGNLVLLLSQASNLVVPFLWRWDDSIGAYRFVYDPTLARGDFEGEIKPWSSYFIFAFQPCTLVVPVSNARKENRLNPSVHLQLFSLKVQRKEGTDKLLLGLSVNSQILEASLPPNPVATTRTALLGTDGTRTGVSIKPESQKVIWSLVLVGSEQDEEVSISSDNLATLSRNWTLTLFDPVANTTHSLRTGTYRLRLLAGEERHLQILAERIFDKPLRVQGLKVISLRGKTVAIEFNLTNSAQTEVAIQTLTGRIVRILDKSFRSSGTHRILWDGSVSSGQNLPAGIYLVKVTARDEKGRIAQSIVSTKLK